MNQIYLYIKSDDSLQFYPQNTPNDFTVELPEIINLKGKWAIALLDIYIKDTLTDPIYILTDICEQSVQNGNLNPILKVIYPDCVHFSNLHYIPVKVSSLKRISIYIRGGSTGKDPILTNIVNLSLHLVAQDE